MLSLRRGLLTSPRQVGARLRRRTAAMESSGEDSSAGHASKAFERLEKCKSQRSTYIRAESTSGSPDARIGFKAVAPPWLPEVEEDGRCRSFGGRHGLGRR